MTVNWFTPLQVLQYPYGEMESVILTLVCDEPVVERYLDSSFNCWENTGLSCMALNFSSTFPLEIVIPDVEKGAFRFLASNAADAGINSRNNATMTVIARRYVPFILFALL